MYDTELLPKWMMRRYLVLRNAIGIKEASFDEVYRVLHKYFKDNEKVVRIFLSEMRKLHWLDVLPNEEDYRMKFYQLKKSEEIFDKAVQEVHAKKVITRKLQEHT